MRFAMLVMSDERSELGGPPDEKMMAEMGRYNAQLIEAKVMLGGEGLAPSSKGARVRLAGKKLSVVDGPFAEAKELVGGFWLVQASSTDEMVAWARKVPFREGELELRPLFEAEDFPADTTEPPSTQSPRKPGTRRYMLMLKADRLTESGAPPSQEVLAQMGALMEDMTRQGALLSGEGLKPSSASKRVKFAGGKTHVIDGPFTESKELIAGYIILQAGSRAEAVEWARRWLEVHAGQPDLEGGEVEVRLVSELEDFPVHPDEQPGGWRDQERKLRGET